MKKSGKSIGFSIEERNGPVRGVKEDDFPERFFSCNSGELEVILGLEGIIGGFVERKGKERGEAG